LSAVHARFFAGTSPVTNSGTAVNGSGHLARY
jgi:hypothetical protein